MKNVIMFVVLTFCLCTCCSLWAPDSPYGSEHSGKDTSLSESMGGLLRACRDLALGVFDVLADLTAAVDSGPDEVKTAAGGGIIAVLAVVAFVIGVVALVGDLFHGLRG